MKIDRHTLRIIKRAVKHRSIIKFSVFCVFGLALASNDFAAAQQKSTTNVATRSANTPTPQSQPKAVALLNQVVQRITLGPAFGAKVRQRVWTAGREVIGVGIYEQAGGGTGRFNLHISMHDGDGKHSLQQISDGRSSRTELP